MAEDIKLRHTVTLRKGWALDGQIADEIVGFTNSRDRGDFLRLLVRLGYLHYNQFPMADLLDKVMRVDLTGLHNLNRLLALLDAKDIKLGDMVDKAIQDYQALPTVHKSAEQESRRRPPAVSKAAIERDAPPDSTSARAGREPQSADTTPSGSARAGMPHSSNMDHEPPAPTTPNAPSADFLPEAPAPTDDDDDDDDFVDPMMRVAQKSGGK